MKEKKMMKEKIKRFGWFIAGFLLMMGTHVMAGSGWKANLKSAAVFDHYHEVVYIEPYTVEVCGEEQMVVGSQADVVNGAIWGAIFGAVVGDAIDDEDGRVPGAVIGALIGAEEGQNQGTVTTTAMVCKQETRQQRTVRNVYSHSTIKFDYEGSYYEVDFTKR
jgi:outer membrane lipoprotein SlyB